LATDSAYRRYSAACPNCGAPVEFASPASASAVCSFCRSTLVRDGDALRKVGRVAEVFDDHSPLQLGVSGRYQGLGFTVIGRLQYRYAEGTWNEWHVLFDQPGADGRPNAGWLSEDNGAYVVSFDAPPPADLPPIGELQVGERRLIGGSGWTVASVQQATLQSAEGELPRPPRLDTPFTVADLRSERGEVASTDNGEPAAPSWSIGRAVALSELALQGLKDIREKTLTGRSLECPNCGSSVPINLSATQSVTCPQCASVIDISKGLGEDLAYYKQVNSGADGLMPAIPLGSVGRLAIDGGAPVPWQVVGYQERCDLPAAGSDDEQTYWREYLLYHPTSGFAFLVDAEDGWSGVRPITGVPGVRTGKATWKDTSYRELYTYNAKTTWVLGEFYWRVQRDDIVRVTDYTGPGGRRLSREQSRTEVVWSAGQVIPAKVIAAAFPLDPSTRARIARDDAALTGLSKSLGGAAGRGFNPGLVMVVVVLFVMFGMSQCSDDDEACDGTLRAYGANSVEYRQCLRQANSGGGVIFGRGGSFGGFSSGGFHK